ncbi:translational activator of cytochrome c oxidase 1 [Atheta coriaria]|uniref:translational activator of cytochrome c oxidase 1 n=1 Tax=Dalotia coriaria TaxID=877792 RepID=UPI0031F3B4CC
MLRTFLPSVNARFLALNFDCAQHLCKRYAGHSKWANIRHTKGAKDAQRGALFTKLAQKMKIAIQEGGSTDPKLNINLEQVLEQARRANMPGATVQSIIKSASTKGTGQKYQIEIRGPGSCIVLVDLFTEHIHHAKQNISTIMKKHGSKYADGGAKHCFEQKGIVIAERPAGKDDAVILEKATDDAIECGAEDVKINDEDHLEFHCAASSLKNVAAVLEKTYIVTSASVEYIPTIGQELTDQEMTDAAKMLDKLEALPEVIQTYNNII